LEPRTNHIAFKQGKINIDLGIGKGGRNKSSGTKVNKKAGRQSRKATNTNNRKMRKYLKRGGTPRMK